MLQMLILLLLILAMLQDVDGCSTAAYLLLPFWLIARLHNWLNHGLKGCRVVFQGPITCL
jgi:hypothetical protein